MRGPIPSGEEASAGGRIGRRVFLGLGVATAGTVLVSCRSGSEPVTEPNGGSGRNGTGMQQRTPSTVDQLLAASPFYIAHRGSGDNWVEHTLDAYTRSIDAGARAIEISVRATLDGVLVCHHDESTLRMTGTDLSIGASTWDELSGLRNDARDWLGPAQPTQPIPLLTEVLDRFAEDFVIFIEDKQGTNTRPLLEILSGYRDATSHFVWKQWAGGSQHRLAAFQGFRTWGYLTSQIIDRAEELAGEFDMIGVYESFDADVIGRVVATGTPVIAWEVHSRSTRDRMRSLGVSGMMCSNILYVTSESSDAISDSFGSGLRSAGDLPWATDRGTDVQPVFDTDEGSVVLDDTDIQSYLMGSLCPIDPNRRIITVDMRWPDAVPDDRANAGIAFGMATDAPYRVRIASRAAGYHLVLRGNGSLDLFRRDAGAVAGTLLGTIRTTPPVLGSWVKLQVELGASAVGFYRLDDAGWGKEVQDAAYRGGYLWLCKNYSDGPAVGFRRVTVS